MLELEKFAPGRTIDTRGPKSSGWRSRAARSADIRLKDGWALQVLSLQSWASLLPAFIARADSSLRFVESIREFDRKVVRLHDPTRSNLGSG
jgi:hypothetical protein